MIYELVLRKFDCSLEFVFSLLLLQPFNFSPVSFAYNFQDCGCVILREIDFLLKICWLIPCLHYLNRGMCKFESSHKNESRRQSTDSLKAYRITSAFKCLIFLSHQQAAKSWHQQNAISSNFSRLSQNSAVFIADLPRLEACDPSSIKRFNLISMFVSACVGRDSRGQPIIDSTYL